MQDLVLDLADVDRERLLLVRRIRSRESVRAS
jgi:hypothetical protein